MRDYTATTDVELSLRDDLAKCRDALAKEHGYRMRVQKDLKDHKAMIEILEERLKYA